MFNTADLFTPMIHIVVVATRLVSLWLFFPVLGTRTIPGPIKIAATLTMSLSLLPLVSPHLPAWSATRLPGLDELVLRLASEFVIGAGMGLVAQWIFSSSLAAAQWVGFQMGFSQGSILQPDLETHESAWTELLNWIAIMLFLGIGGHWFFIQAMADSYTVDTSQVFARLTQSEKLSQLWIEVGTGFFTWMLKLSGPLVVVMLLLQAAMGVLSRFIPQINVWIVSIPLTIGVGVFVFTLLSPMYGDALNGLFESTFNAQHLFIRVLGGK
jgi:flagellar biosynthetic protein FliR